MASSTWQPGDSTRLILPRIKRNHFVNFYEWKILQFVKKMEHLYIVPGKRCYSNLDTTVEKLVEAFEVAGRKPGTSDYPRKLLEFCSLKALSEECKYIEEKIKDGSFSRFTIHECVGKGREEKKIPAEVSKEQDEIPLFYTDLMPLLVNDGPNVGEDAFVWLASLVPLPADVVNGRFTFEALTATTSNRLFFPGYDKFLQEIERYIKQLEKEAKPKGVELANDEVKLHVEGTTSSLRVVRHIGGINWPGRLTLTNYAFYFEASGVLTYEDALKIDLSKDTKHSVKPAATGPWGAPIFDKAIVYESPELAEGIVLEFPELTSSTRRNLWLALIKEIILMHQFLLKYRVECPVQALDLQARTILGIIRLHAAREMLRISPPEPKNFLIFALFDELPKGDYVLEELAESLKKADSGNPCSTIAALRNMNMLQAVAPCIEVQEVVQENLNINAQDGIRSSLESAVNQAREEAKEIDRAKATTEVLKEEGIGESAAILTELLKPLKSLVLWFRKAISWKRPITTVIVLAATLVIIYKEWVGKAIAGCLLWAVLKMLLSRLRGKQDQCNNEIVVCTGSEQKSTVESIVTVQYGLKNVHEMMQTANITILKIWSIMWLRARKQVDTVTVAMSVLAIIFAVIPVKYILMAVVLHCFIATSKLGEYMQNDQGNRRLKEWWDSIPIVPVRIEDKPPQCAT